MRILVVDDSRDHADVLVALLRSYRLDAHSAYGSGDALTHLSRQPADFLVTDLAMPDMNGFQLAHTARLMHPSIRVVAYTVRRSEPLEPEAECFGIERIFIKIKDFDELMGTLRHAAVDGLMAPGVL